MSLKKNIAANYVGQIYVTLIGIVMVPLYVRYMGAEAYGLVGFFAMLQGWFQLLDMGLTPTIARETARFNGGAIDSHSLRRLLRALEGVFFGVALLGGAMMMAGASAIAQNWLKVHELPLHEVANAIKLIAATVSLRWIGGLYRGAISGFERQVWLSGFNILAATARFVLVLPLLIFISATPKLFFSYQLAVAVIEVLVLMIFTYRLLAVGKAKVKIRWEWAPLRDVLKFSLGIAFTSSVWVFITQTDKLLLSKFLPLADYAYFSLAVLVASGVMMASGPISNALLPRMTRLAAERDDEGLFSLYRGATQMVAVIAVPAALTLAFFSRELLWAWTGDAVVATRAAPVLCLYALGNGILALGAFPYYLQYAKGDLRLHLIGNALFAILLIPALVWATIQYGMIGAGYVWFTSNLVYFLGWVPVVHRRFMPGKHLAWVLHDIGFPFIASVGFLILAHRFLLWPQNRGGIALVIVLTGGCGALAAAVGSSRIRHVFRGGYFGMSLSSK